MGKLRRSWRLMVATLRLLKKNPKLLVFPLISGAIMFVLAVLIVGGGAVYLSQHWAGGGGSAEALSNRVWWSLLPVMAAVYLVGSFITIFCNSALVGCVLRSLEGKPDTWRDGLRLAWARRGAIFSWALLFASVGLLLNWLESKLSSLPFLGALVSRLALRLCGAAWSLVTFLIVPVIVFEEHPSVWARLRRSVELFKRTWGEQILGRAGAGAALGLLFLAVLVPLWAVVIAMGVTCSTSALGVVIVIALLVSLVLGFSLALVSAALNGIYTGVLYSYAVTGMLPQEFSPDLLPQPKKA